MLAARPSLLVILSGGSSYSIGASGSFAFFPFFAGAEPVSFSPSAAASSAFLPLFMLELALTANTLLRHTTRTHNSTHAVVLSQQDATSRQVFLHS